MKIKHLKVLLLMALPLLGGAGRAQAQTTLNFDDNLSDGTVLTGFYSNITFSNPIGGYIYARVGLSSAASYPNVVSVMSPSGGPAPSSQYPFFNAQFGAVDATFSTPQKIVTIDAAPVSDLEPLGTPQNRPYLEAYAANNVFLGRVLYQGALPTDGGFATGPYETLTFTSTTANIVKMRFSSQQSQPGPRIFGLFDNLTYRATDPPVQISGRVVLEGIKTNDDLNITFLLRPKDGSGDITQILTLDPRATFVLANLPRKNYTLHIKADKYLAVNVNANATAGDVEGVRVTLPAGDADNNNIVDIGDFGIVVGAFGSVADNPTSGYDARADFDGDGRVDVADFGLLVNNYGAMGAP